MKRIYQVTALAGAILAGAGGLAVAHGGPDGDRHGHHHRHAHHKMHHGFGHKSGGPMGFSLRHVDGSLAFLKAELQITEQQEPQWAQVETALRASADRMKELRTEMRGERGERAERGEKAEKGERGPRGAKGDRAERPRLNPVERLERMEKMATSRAESAREIRTALAPLYESMSDEQKERADRFMRRMPIGR